MIIYIYIRLQPTLNIDEKQVEENESPLEEENKDEGHTIILGDFVSFVTPPSFPCGDVGKQCDEEDLMQDEPGMHDFNPIACDEFSFSIPLHDSSCSCKCNGEPCKCCKEIDEWLIMDQRTLKLAKLFEESRCW